MGKPKLTTLNSLLTERTTAPTLAATNKLQTTLKAVKTKVTTLASTIATTTKPKKTTKSIVEAVTSAENIVGSTTRTRGCIDYYDEYNEYCATIGKWDGTYYYSYTSYGYWSYDNDPDGEYILFYPKDYEPGQYNYIDYYESEDYLESIDEVFGSVSLGAISLIAIPVLCMALYVIKVNDKIAKDIKPLFYIETLCRVLIIMLQTLWGIQAQLYLLVFTSFGYPDGSFFSYNTTDEILTFLYFLMLFTIVLTQFMMSLTRFFAVEFNGLYYGKIQWKIYWKLLFIFLPSILLNAPFFFSMYSMGLEADMMQFRTVALIQQRMDPQSAGLLRLWLQRYENAVHFYIPMLFWIGESVMDCMVLRTVFTNAKKTRDAQSKKRNMELRLAITTLINHCANAVCTVGNYLTNFWHMGQTFQFVVGSMFPLAIYTLFGLNIIVFLWTRRGGNDSSASSKITKSKTMEKHPTK